MRHNCFLREVAHFGVLLKNLKDKKQQLKDLAKRSELTNFA